MATREMVTQEAASPEAAKILSGIKGKLGVIPNIFSAMAHSPATLNAFLTFSEMVGKGELTPREIEAVDLAIAQENSCDYCLAIHAAMARARKFTDDEIIAARKARSNDLKLNSLVSLAREVVATKGRPAQGSIDAFFAAGYTKGALAMLIAVVAKNIFTNYFNHIAGTPLDHPAVTPL